jgi:hypothetical protein
MTSPIKYVTPEDLLNLQPEMFPTTEDNGTLTTSPCLNKSTRLKAQLDCVLAKVWSPLLFVMGYLLCWLQLVQSDQCVSILAEEINSVKKSTGYEVSSSHGGEYDVQSCLLGYTAV